MRDVVEQREGGVQDVAARLAAVDADRSVPTAGTSVEPSYRLTQAEQAALRAESKRLRRAAEHQLFATLCCEALHSPDAAEPRAAPAANSSWDGDAAASVRSEMRSSQRVAPAGDQAPWLASPRRRRLQDSLIAVGDSARAPSSSVSRPHGASLQRAGTPFSHLHATSPPAGGKLRRLVQQRFAEHQQQPLRARTPAASERNAAGTPPFAARPRSATLSHDTHAPPHSRATADRYAAVADEDSASVALSPPAVGPHGGGSGEGERRDLQARLQAIRRDLAAVRSTCMTLQRSSACSSVPRWHDVRMVLINADGRMHTTRHRFACRSTRAHRRRRSPLPRQRWRWQQSRRA